MIAGPAPYGNTCLVAQHLVIATIAANVHRYDVRSADPRETTRTQATTKRIPHGLDHQQNPPDVNNYRRLFRLDFEIYE